MLHFFEYIGAGVGTYALCSVVMARHGRIHSSADLWAGLLYVVLATAIVLTFHALS